MPSVSVDIREPKHLWLAQTAETRMTTMCPWILAPHHSALPRLTVLRISTSLWARGPITLIFQDSLQHYLPERGAVPPCATGLVVSVMSPRRPSTATSNPTGNVSFWQLRSHRDTEVQVLMSAVVFPQRSQHLSIWRTMGSLMSCHLRVQSPCHGHGPCECHINDPFFFFVQQFLSS